MLWGKGKEALPGSFIKVLIPFMRVLSRGFNHLPKAPSPKTTTLGVKFQHKNWGWAQADANIQTIAERRD